MANERAYSKRAPTSFDISRMSRLFVLEKKKGENVCKCIERERGGRGGEGGISAWMIFVCGRRGESGSPFVLVAVQIFFDVVELVLHLVSTFLFRPHVAAGKISEYQTPKTEEEFSHRVGQPLSKTPNPQKK